MNIYYVISSSINSKVNLNKVTIISKLATLIGLPFLGLIPWLCWCLDRCHLLSTTKQVI